MLRRKAIRRFRTAKAKTAALDFDELNVMAQFKTLYEALEADNEEAFLALARGVYEGDEPPTKAWLRDLLDQYDPVLLYVYGNEVVRKRDRAAEAVNGAQDKGYEFKKALTYWSRMTAWEADTVEYEAAFKALEDSGVEKVRWNTAEDEKVCETCGPRNGKIYPIDKVPDRPHPGCRCWLTAVT